MVSEIIHITTNHKTKIERKLIMILNQITPTGSKTFDTAFNNACKLIIHDTSPRYYEFYSEGIDRK